MGSSCARQMVLAHMRKVAEESTVTENRPGQWPSAMPFLSGFVLTAALCRISCAYLMVTNTNPDFALFPRPYQDRTDQLYPGWTHCDREHLNSTDYQSQGRSSARQSPLEIWLEHEQNVGKGDRLFSWNWHQVNIHSALTYNKAQFTMTFTVTYGSYICSKLYYTVCYKYHMVLTYVIFFIQPFKTLYYQTIMEGWQWDTPDATQWRHITFVENVTG